MPEALPYRVSLGLFRYAVRIWQAEVLVLVFFENKLSVEIKAGFAFFQPVSIANKGKSAPTLVKATRQTFWVFKI